MDSGTPGQAKCLIFKLKFKQYANPSHFSADGPEIGSQMSYGALEPRTDSSRTRRIQPRQRESLKRAISGPNGPVFGHHFSGFSGKHKVYISKPKGTRDFARPGHERLKDRPGTRFRRTSPKMLAGPVREPLVEGCLARAPHCGCYSYWRGG